MSQYIEQSGTDIKGLLGEYGELVRFRKAKASINRNTDKARILVQTWPPMVRKIGEGIIDNYVSEAKEVMSQLEEGAEKSLKKGVGRFHQYLTNENPSLVRKLFDINLSTFAHTKRLEIDIESNQKEIEAMGEGFLSFLKKDKIAHTPAEVVSHILEEDSYLIDLVLTAYHPERGYDRNLQIYCDLDNDTLERKAQRIIDFYYSKFLPILKLLRMEKQIIKERVALNGRKKWGPHHILISNRMKKIKRRIDLEIEKKSKIKGRLIKLAKKYVGEFKERFPGYNLQIVTMGSIIPEFKVFSYYGDPEGDMKAVSDIDITLYHKGNRLEYAELREFTEEFSRKHKIHFSTPQRELIEENYGYIRGIIIHGKWKALGYRLSDKLTKCLEKIRSK